MLIHFLEYFEETVFKTFWVSHLPDDLTVLTCDTFNSINRSVRIVFRIHAWFPSKSTYWVKIWPLSPKLCKFFSCHDKLPFTVWYWDGMDVITFTPASHGEFVLEIRVSKPILATCWFRHHCRRGLDSCCSHLQSYHMEEGLIWQELGTHYRYRWSNHHLRWSDRWPHVLFHWARYSR